MMQRQSASHQVYVEWLCAPCLRHSLTCTSAIHQWAPEWPGGAALPSSTASRVTSACAKPCSADRHCDYTTPQSQRRCSIQEPTEETEYTREHLWRCQASCSGHCDWQCARGIPWHGMMSQRSVSMLLMHAVAWQAVVATLSVPSHPQRLMAAVSNLEEGAMPEAKLDVVEGKTATARKKKSGTKVRACRTADWV